MFTKKTFSQKKKLYKKKFTKKNWPTFFFYHFFSFFPSIFFFQISFSEKKTFFTNTLFSPQNLFLNKNLFIQKSCNLYKENQATSSHKKITQSLKKTLQELQDAALRTSYRWSNVSNCSFQNYRERFFFTVLTAVTVFRKFTQPLHQKNHATSFLLNQYFWKVQFDTFDN